MYRNAEPGAQLRILELTRLRRDQAHRLPRELVGVYGRRLARAAAGATVLVLVAPAAAFIALDADPGMFAWAAVLPALVLFGRACAACHLRERMAMAAVPPASDDERAQLDYLEHTSPAELARERADRLERLSIGLPLLALVLALPLALYTVGRHLAVEGGDADGSQRWRMLFLLVSVGLHVALGAASWRFARRLREQTTAQVADVGPWTGLAAIALVVATIAATFSLLCAIGYGPVDRLTPGSGLVLLPICAVDLLAVPAAFRSMARRVEAERLLLERGISQPSRA